MKSIKALVLIVFVMVTLLTACTPTAVPNVPVKIRIGTQPWIGYGPWWIAQEKGMFEKYGLNVELVDFVEDKEVNAAFASGNMDAANLATHTAIKLFSAGVDLKLVLLEDVSTSADAIIADMDINSIEDLRGKDVAYEEGATSDLLLNYALNQNNMSLADINPIPMPASDAGTALLSGRVPAAVTYEPYISEVLKGNENTKVLYKAEERPGLISDVFVVSSEFAKNNPDSVKALLIIWDEALAFYNSDPSTGQAIISKAVGSEPADLVTAFKGVKFYSLAENQAELGGKFLTIINDVAEVSKSIGLFDTIPDLQKMIDAGFLK